MVKEIHIDGVNGNVSIIEGPVFKTLPHPFTVNNGVLTIEDVEKDVVIVIPEGTYTMLDIYEVGGNVIVKCPNCHFNALVVEDVYGDFKFEGTYDSSSVEDIEGKGEIDDDIEFDEERR